MKRGNKRTILVLFKDKTTSLDYVGLFLNPRHLEDYFDLKVDNSQIGRYLKNEIHTIMDYILVELETGKNPCDSLEIIEKARTLAMVRKQRSFLMHLNNEVVINLSDEKITAINKIINT